jgi:hypothetical protein
MTIQYATPPAILSRDLFVAILRTALSVQEYRFARQAALSWLTAFPGDLPVRLLYAQTLLAGGQPEQALPILENLCQTDPEFTEAVQTYHRAAASLQVSHPAQQTKLAGFHNPMSTLDWMIALGVPFPTPKGAAADDKPSWAQQLCQARQALNSMNGSPPAAEALDQAGLDMQPALAADPATPLVAATHLRILQAQAVAQNAPPQALQSLAEFYLQRWPDCLQCSLVLADGLMCSGEPDRAVALLHQAAARDITGQVATRLWGHRHPYKGLWPDRLEMRLEMPIPASVAAVMGWNQLPEYTLDLPEAPVSVPPWEDDTVEIKLPPVFEDWQPPATATPTIDEPLQTAQTAATTSEAAKSASPETLRMVQAELERVASHLKRPALARTDGRFPVYVLITTRQGLAAQYGVQAADQIEIGMKQLAEGVRQRGDWRGMLFYADQGIKLRVKEAIIEVKPARYNDPWGLKLALADLDAALAHNGEMIGAVLIVGGPEVVPFHHLPNPVDDADVDVPSDNPYGTRDENYYIPEWPVGRLPGGAAGDPQALVQALEQLAQKQGEDARQIHPAPWYVRLWQAVMARLHLAPGDGRRPGRVRQSLGYSAAVWRRASLAVFRPIGESGGMLVSPPLRSPALSANGSGLDERDGLALPAARLGYFNLHGLLDAAEWYGQADLTESRGEADYPVALRPADIPYDGRAPQIIFTEACYGAHILGKDIDEALALKFLQAGSQAVVGSTCTSYGAIAAPLTAADFLGYAFWSNIREGLPAGEALRRAKIALAREMSERQGYLDGEDQKTLISFVLYGDPLAQVSGVKPSAKAVLRAVKPAASLHTVCDRACGPEGSQLPDSDQLAYVKGIVEKYLPGMADASLQVSKEHTNCRASGGCCAGAPALSANKQRQPAPERQPNRSVVTLSKVVNRQAHQHHHFARLTLDGDGKLVKLVVSR